MTKNVLIIIVLFSFQLQSYGQKDSIKEVINKVEEDFNVRTISDSTSIDSLYSWHTKSWGITTGINFNSKLTYEIGFGRANYGEVWHHWFLSNYYLGSEFTFNDDKLILAPKASIWINGGSAGLALGLNLINYTDFSESSLILL